MKLTTTKLNRIYDRTSGYCHICGAKLAFENYGQVGARGAWEVEHSVPRAKGGSDLLSNLYAAHVSCNRPKQSVSTRTARRWYGRSAAPLSQRRRGQERLDNALAGAGIGVILGAPGGAAGALLGLLVGACVGSDLTTTEYG